MLILKTDVETFLYPIVYLQVVTDIALVQVCSTQVIDDFLVVFIVIDKSLEDLGAASDTTTNLNKETARTDLSEAGRTDLRDIVVQKIRSSLPDHYSPDHVIQINSLPITKHGMCRTCCKLRILDI